MNTIAIVGAGPGLGAAVAEKFGREGFAVALLSRDAGKLAGLVDDLAARAVSSGAYPVDVRDPAALRLALARAAEELGTIEVLQYSPVPSGDLLRPLLETSVEDLRAATEFSVLGPAAAVEQVLPGMTRIGRGTILLVNGSSAVVPNANVAGTSIAFAGESAYGALLHGALAERGVHVGQLIVPGAIQHGDPTFGPDVLADRLWQIHRERGAYRVTVGGPA